jgi:hypothetical protein
MGGSHGEVRGETKEEVWRKYQIHAKSLRASGLTVDYPANKQAAYKAMAEKNDQGEYVLSFRFSKD